MSRLSLTVASAAAVCVCSLPTFAQTGSNSCSTPDAIAGSGAFPFTTVGATTDGTTAVACNFFSVSQIYNDVWFCWTAGANGPTTIWTCGTTWDTKLAVYADCTTCPGEGTILDCDDDTACASGGTTQSTVTFSATAGASYMIRVGAYGATTTGVGTLTIGNGSLADVVNPANNHRYVLFPAAGWVAAEAAAVQFGGHLVTINDADESAWIQQQFGVFGGVSRRLWIGLNDVASEGNWAWTSGEPVTFLSWNAGEPNNAGNAEHYVEFLGLQALWNDMPQTGGTAPHLALFELGPATPPCPGDLDGDFVVGGTDLTSILSNWGQPGSADINGDGIVDGIDLSVVLGGWGDCP